MKHFFFLHSDGWLYVYEMFSFIWRQGNQNQLKLPHWRERKRVGVGQAVLLPPCFSRVVAGRRAPFAKEHGLQLIIAPSPVMAAVHRGCSSAELSKQSPLLWEQCGSVGPACAWLCLGWEKAGSRKPLWMKRSCFHVCPGPGSGSVAVISNILFKLVFSTTCRQNDFYYKLWMIVQRQAVEIR